MGEYFGVLPNELPSGTDWENRLQAVEGELVKVVGVAQRIIAVESAIAELRQSLILEPMIQEQLAARLKVNTRTITRNRDRENFGKWSKQHDPNDNSWEYRASERMFYPVESSSQKQFI